MGDLVSEGGICTRTRRTFRSVCMGGWTSERVSEWVSE